MRIESIKVSKAPGLAPDTDASLHEARAEHLICVERGPGPSGCREEAAGTGHVCFQTRSPPRPGGPGPELEMGAASSPAPLPGSWAHMKARHTSGTGRCAEHLDVLRSLSGFLLLVL